MKVLFLNPAYGKDFCKSARWYAKSRGRVQRHPDYLCMAVAVVEEAGHQCKFVDGAAKGLSKEETALIIKEYLPDMVVIQTTTPSIYSDISYGKLAKDILRKDCLTLLVGTHITAEPEDTMQKSIGSVDILARGEYDYTLRDVASGMPLDKILGISYRIDSNIIHNKNRPAIENMDELPFPAWRHIDINDYHDAGKLFPFITLISGRGCEGKCTFCQFPQVMYGRRYRTRSVEKVLAEIQYDLELFPNLKEIMFEDDALTLFSHRARLREICQGIIDRKFNISWSANARADLTDFDTLKLMKKSGCRMLCVGFEFGSQQILNAVNKGIKLERMLEFAKLAKKAGIRIHGCFMIGGPGETKETSMETIKFAQKLCIDTVQFSGVCAYPGTEYYKWVRDNGFLVPKDWNAWVDDNLEQRAIVNFPQLSVDEINNFVDLGIKKFYLRPTQIFRMLCNIQSWADVKTKFFGLKSFIDYFRKNSSKNCAK